MNKIWIKIKTTYKWIDDLYQKWFEATFIKPTYRKIYTFLGVSYIGNTLSFKGIFEVLKNKSLKKN